MLCRCQGQIFHQHFFPWSDHCSCWIRGGSRTPLMNPFRGGPLQLRNPERPPTIVLLTPGFLVGCFLASSLAQVLALTLICYLAYLRFSRV